MKINTVEIIQKHHHCIYQEQTGFLNTLKALTRAVSIINTESYKYDGRLL